MDDVVDVLVATWNTLPWLKLLESQLKRFKPSIPIRLCVWDNASQDGTQDWLVNNGKINHHLDPAGRSHADSLSGLLEMSDAPYVAFLDVDAAPVQDGWLDEAVQAVKNEKIGGAGLSAGRQEGHHRVFVHPSFCVFRRELYGRLKLSPKIVHDFDRRTAFDVGETISSRLQDEGYELRFFGSTSVDSFSRERWVNKVIHFGASTPVLSEKRDDRAFLDMVEAVVNGHKRLLSLIGVLEEFKKYAMESVPLNPRCARYL